jgi:polyphosphate kinase
VESVVPVEDPALQDALRFVLDTQLGDRRSAWEMQADGTYRQRIPGRGRRAKSSQLILAEHAEKRLKEATRRRKRRPRSVSRRGPS